LSSVLSALATQRRRDRGLELDCSFFLAMGDRAMVLSAD